MVVDGNLQNLASDLTEKSVWGHNSFSWLIESNSRFKTFLSNGAYDRDTLYRQVISAKNKNCGFRVSTKYHDRYGYAGID
ncbi:MAG: hypothetical protein HRT54_21405 [Colwellia sp.]|nr:hypothetical protein [Colwellia sp.]